MVARLKTIARAMPARSPFHQRNPGALHRDFGPGSHGYANGGRGQGRRIVHAVARHRHDVPLFREFSDDAMLILRQNVGVDLRDAELAGHGFGCRAIVAGEHDDPNAGLPQIVERRPRDWP